MQSESIYNIIPKEYVPPPKEAIYRSKYPPNIPPTGSTFCNKTTSKPNHAGNLNGDFNRGLQAHTEFAHTKTFGHLTGDRKSDPKNFLKKQTGTMGNQQLPVPNQFLYDCQHKKAPTPTVNDKPVQGLRSGKNFIITNAIENILSTPKQMVEQTDWKRKKDYGKSPEYLSKIRQNIDNQYQMIQNLHQQHQYTNDCLSEIEINKLRDGLKKKWDEVNHQYQKLTHIKTIDTFGLKSRKQGCEKQLSQIETDIKKLNKNYVFVE